MFTNRANQNKWVVRFDQKNWEECWEIFMKYEQAMHWGKMIICEDFKRPKSQQQFKNHECFEIGQIDFNDPRYDYHIIKQEIIKGVDRTIETKETDYIKNLAINPFKDGIPTINYYNQPKEHDFFTGKLLYKDKVIGKIPNKIEYIKSSKLCTDGLKEVKQCVICDQVLGDQNTPYEINHYLCSEYCTCHYMEMVIWNINTFKIHLPKLNEYRRLCGLSNLTSEEVDKRIDLPEYKKIEGNILEVIEIFDKWHNTLINSNINVNDVESLLLELKDHGYKLIKEENIK